MGPMISYARSWAWYYWCWTRSTSPLQNNISIDALSFSDDDDGDILHTYYNTEMKFVVNQLRCIAGTTPAYNNDCMMWWIYL